MLQSVVSPCDSKQSDNGTATSMSNSSSTLIDYIITDYYQTGIVVDTILKTDHFATIIVLKSVILNFADVYYWRLRCLLCLIVVLIASLYLPSFVGFTVIVVILFIWHC